jgi:glycosyltransferase involved in cell wall biosynthesis
MAKVSVIMPCFNHGAYLQDSIGSIRAQTHSEWELIFVDDGSTDNSFSRAEELTSEFSSVQLIQQVNRGQSGARQVGLEAADGEYVVVLDSDDYLEPEMMALCIDRFNLDEKVNVVVGDAWATGEDIHAEKKLLEQRKLPGWPGILRQNYFGMSSALMFRRKDALAVGGLDAGVKNGAEDWDFWVRLLRMGCRFSILREPVSRYRLGEASDSLDFTKSLDGIIQLLDFSIKKDSRIIGRQSAPITKRLYSTYRNGQVMRSFVCNWILGKSESELRSNLSLLDENHLHTRYCRDMMVGGAVRIAQGEQKQYSPIPVDIRNELIRNIFAQKGISNHTSSTINCIDRVWKENLVTYSLAGRVREKWYEFRGNRS